MIPFLLPQSIPSHSFILLGRTARIGNQGLATSFYNSDRNSDMGPEIVKLLIECGQTVPDFLEGDRPPNDQLDFNDDTDDENDNNDAGGWGSGGGGGWGAPDTNTAAAPANDGWGAPVDAQLPTTTPDNFIPQQGGADW